MIFLSCAEIGNILIGNILRYVADFAIKLRKNNPSIKNTDPR